MMIRGGELYTTNENEAQSPEFDLELLQELVNKAKSLPYPMKPAVDGYGREFYLIWSTRERIIQELRPGWTYRAVPFKGAEFCVYEPCRIEDVFLWPGPVQSFTGYWYDN